MTAGYYVGEIRHEIIRARCKQTNTKIKWSKRQASENRSTDIEHDYRYRYTDTHRHPINLWEPSTLHRIRLTAIGSMVQLRPLPSLPSLGVMTIHKIMLLSLFTLIAVTSASASAIESASNERCETLKTSLTYTQENAPQDISGVVSNIILYCTVLYCTVLYCTVLCY